MPFISWTLLQICLFEFIRVEGREFHKTFGGEGGKLWKSADLCIGCSLEMVTLAATESYQLPEASVVW
jgi:hypothetical protein